VVLLEMHYALASYIQNAEQNQNATCMCVVLKTVENHALTNASFAGASRPNVNLICERWRRRRELLMYFSRAKWKIAMY